MSMNLCFACMQELQSSDILCPHCGYDNHIRDNGPGMLRGEILAGKYLTGILLGRGGFGATYIGYDMLMKRLVAIKEYLPGQLVIRDSTSSQLSVITGSEADFIKGKERALKEGRMAASAGQIPGVVQIYDVLAENNTIYIIMEYVQGDTLSKHVRHLQKPMSVTEAVSLLDEVALALNSLHQRKIVHRDVKPDNIILRTETKKTVLLDFGAARIADERTLSNSAAVVSPGYAPPEQYESISLDGRIDQYALASTIYFMVTGKRPVDSIIRLVNNTALQDIRSLNPSVTELEQKVLMKAMSVKAEDRYRTLGDFWIALKNATKGIITREKPKRKALIAIASAVVAVTAAAVSIFLLPGLMQCKHQWTEPTCTLPKTCILCGEVEGKPLAHRWQKADCTTSKTCSLCGHTEGDPLGHSWVEADCINPKTCKACGLTEDAPLGHSWQTADCTSPKTCTICGFKEGAAAGHSWMEATCFKSATCSVCGVIQGEPAGHSYDIFPLEGKRKCVRCDLSEPWQHLDNQTIAAGGTYTVAIQRNQTLVFAGQLPEGEGDISGWTDIIQTSAARNHILGLRLDGTVVAAGNNDQGQCQVENWTDIVYISAGDGHSVALRGDGTVLAAGNNDHGQCNVEGWNNIVCVAAGEHHTLGLRADGTVVATGLNEHGQCAVEDWTDVISISAGNCSMGLRKDGSVVAAGQYIEQFNLNSWQDIIAISAGSSHLAGLKKDGTVLAVQPNRYGVNIVKSWSDIVGISVGDDFIVGQRKNGTLVAEGFNDYGQCEVAGWNSIAIGTAAKKYTIVPPQSGLQCRGQKLPFANFIDVSEKHFVALNFDGTVRGTAVLGDGENTWSNVIQVEAGAHPSRAYAGPFTLLLFEDGTVQGIGTNYFAQCNVSNWTDIVQISAGYIHSVGLKRDGTVVATGDNGNWQCAVRDWTDIVQVSAGSKLTAGLKKDGTVVVACKKLTGIEDVKNWTDIVQVEAGDNHMVGLKSDGTVLITGNDTHGRTDVSSWTDIVQVEATRVHTVGLRSDGTVVAVGDNSNGRCDVDDWMDIVAISASEKYTVGLRADGTILVAGVYIDRHGLFPDRDDLADVPNWKLFDRP